MYGLVADEGMDIHTQKCEDIIGNDVILTPSSQRSGKEHYHEERQHAQEYAHDLQERGKRKCVEKAIANSIIISSSERSDRAESAQKYRRMNKSPSPIIMQEQVSCLPVFVSNYEL